MKKLLALVMAVALVMSVMVMPAFAADVEKPEKITIFIDGTVVTQPNGQAEFEAKWEELSGIELEIIQPDHDAYYDVLQQQIASGDWPDVMILSSTYYAAYANEGVLWDMTEAWDNSATKASGRVKNIDVIEGLGLPYHLGNAVKYIARAGHKDPEKTTEDLQKAVWYLNRYIALLEKEQEARHEG